MPDPDPQPPQPRAVSPARWVLMLLPSVPMMIPPLIVESWTRPPAEYGSITLLNRLDQGYTSWSFLVGAFSLGVAVSAVLSLAIGLLLEHSLRGRIANVWRATLGYGFLLFAANCLAAIVGCAISGVFR